jgi:hypothetical protein
MTPSTEQPFHEARQLRYALRAISWVNGAPLPPDIAGSYICRYNPDTDGEVDILCSPLLEEARLFDSPAELQEFRAQVSAVRPLREDGKPNRPLTALTLEICSYQRPGGS